MSVTLSDLEGHFSCLKPFSMLGLYHGNDSEMESIFIAYNDRIENGLLKVTTSGSHVHYKSDDV